MSPLASPPTSSPLRRLPRLRRRALPSLLAAVALAALAACGGGGGTDDNGTDTTAQAFTQGTITGFGSVIVNGVRFDDSRARIVDEDDNPSAEDLKLGMRVEIQSTRVDDSTKTATAGVVRVGAELKGLASAPDAAAGTFTLIDQTVEVSSTTVFGTGIASVSDVAGKLVEVHAVYDATSGHYKASFVQLEDNLSFYRLRGPVSALDTAAKTFRIGAAEISYAGLAAADLPANLADGVVVRVRLQPQKVAGQWIAVSLRSGVRKVEDQAEAHLRGAITAFTDAQHFSVDGIVVDASGARFPDGTAGVVLGAMVEVEGTSSNGVLTATQVELENRHLADDDRRPELHGSITSIDTAAKTFVLRGVTVSYAGLGTSSLIASLAVGLKVEVKGTLGSDGKTVVATRIQRED